MKSKKLTKTYFELYTIGATSGWGHYDDETLDTTLKTLKSAMKEAKILADEGQTVKIKQVKELLFIKGEKMKVKLSRSSRSKNCCLSKVKRLLDIYK
jgi:hypothetical protein